MLHPTSLPGPHGCGDLGPAAFAFVDFLAAAGWRWWQMLPIVPPGPGNGPYSSYSAFAGSPLLVSLDQLAAEGLLDSAELKSAGGLRDERVAYPATTRFRTVRLRSACAQFFEQPAPKQADFERFCAQHAEWLDDFALFAALKRAYRTESWLSWPRELRRRDKAALRQAAAKSAGEVRFQKFVQYQFDRQWAALRAYARQRGVALMGDIPIFVSHESSDVWANPALFDLYADGRAKTVSGVPPDLFSKTGQLWGHPQYNWRRHQRNRFAWWLARFARTFAQFDAVRIDHFLGFNRVWAVSGGAKTAQRGRWVKTPGHALFSTLREKLGPLEIVAEDLGVLTPAAARLRDAFAFPGMRLLHFAFGSDGDHYHEPDAHGRHCVVYPGTHDNDTTVGWFAELRRQARRAPKGQTTQYERVLRYTGSNGREIHWDMIRLALSSVADTAIIPAQDLLGLGNEARMNLPATATGNWEWRLPRGRLNAALAARMREMAVTYDRVRPAHAKA